MVPEGWERRPIKDLCESIIDCVNKTAKHVDFETPYKMIRTTNVRHGRVDTSSVRYVEEETYKQWIRRGAPRDGDIIFTREAPVGEAGILEESEGIFLGQRTMMYRAHPEKSDNRFLLYSLLSGHCQKQIEDLSNGGTVAHMRVPDCGEIFIYSPPLPEQRKIAKILQTWDHAIATTEKLINASKQQKKALMQQLLTGKKRFAGFGGEWEEVTLASLALKGRKNFIDGDWVESPHISDSGCRLIQTGNIGIGEFRNKNSKYISDASFEELRCTEVNVGDLLICRLAEPAGRACVVPELNESKMLTSVDVSIVKIDTEKTSPKYLAAYFSLDRTLYEVSTLCGGSTRSRISRTNLEKMTLPIGSLAEQAKINRVISSVIAEITMLQTKLLHLKQEKKALMQQLLTGKRRVKVDAL